MHTTELQNVSFPYKIENLQLADFSRSMIQVSVSSDILIYKVHWDKQYIHLDENDCNLKPLNSISSFVWYVPELLALTTGINSLSSFCRISHRSSFSAGITQKYAYPHAQVMLCFPIDKLGGQTCKNEQYPTRHLHESYIKSDCFPLKFTLK